MSKPAAKQPWSKFYSADWRADVALGMCSLAARGLWIELICLMNETELKGSLTRHGKPLTVNQIAVLVRSSVDEIQPLLDELEREGVFSRDVDGTIYSRRMRRDALRAEQDKANGSLGGNPSLKGQDIRRDHPEDNPGVNPQDKVEDKAQKLEARNQKEEYPAPSAAAAKPQNEHSSFPEFYAAYPKHVDRKAAAVKYAATVKSGVPPDRLLAAAQRFAEHCRRTRTEPQFIKSPVVWLNKGCWDDELAGSPPAFAPQQIESSDEGYRLQLKLYCNRLSWDFDGPPPGIPGCAIPQTLLDEFRGQLPAEAVRRIWPHAA